MRLTAIGNSLLTSPAGSLELRVDAIDENTGIEYIIRAKLNAMSSDPSLYSLSSMAQQITAAAAQTLSRNAPGESGMTATDERLRGEVDEAQTEYERHKDIYTRFVNAVLSERVPYELAIERPGVKGAIAALRSRRTYEPIVCATCVFAPFMPIAQPCVSCSCRSLWIPSLEILAVYERKDNACKK